MIASKGPFERIDDRYKEAVSVLERIVIEEARRLNDVYFRVQTQRPL